MNKSDLKSHIYMNNPQWRSVGAMLSPAGIDKLIDTSFNVAHLDGFKKGYEAAQAQQQIEYQEAIQKAQSAPVKTRAVRICRYLRRWWISRFTPVRYK